MNLDMQYVAESSRIQRQRFWGGRIRRQGGRGRPDLATGRSASATTTTCRHHSTWTRPSAGIRDVDVEVLPLVGRELHLPSASSSIR